MASGRSTTITITTPESKEPQPDENKLSITEPPKQTPPQTSSPFWDKWMNSSKRLFETQKGPIYIGDEEIPGCIYRVKVNPN